MLARSTCALLLLATPLAAPSATIPPQIRDPEKEKAACASPRACVASFPTTVVEGMLFAWLESGPEAEKEAAAQQPYIMPEQVGGVGGGDGYSWALLHTTQPHGVAWRCLGRGVQVVASAC